METVTKSMETVIVCDSQNEHTYSVTKKLSGQEGKSALLIGLYPTLGKDDSYHLDSTLKGLLNHLEELGINEVMIVNLFSKRTVGAKLSARGLTVDEENLTYIENILKAKDFNSMVILAWGTTMSTSQACNEAKERVVQMLKKYRKKEIVYQLDCKNLELEENIAPHVLYLGIRHTNDVWFLSPFPMKKFEAIMEERKKKREQVVKLSIVEQEEKVEE